MYACVLIFLNLAKLDNFLVKIVIATGWTEGLALWIIDCDVDFLQVQAVKRELELNLSVKSSPVSSTGSLSTASPTSTSSTSKPITNHSHVVPFPNNPPNFNGTQVGAFIHPNHAFNNHFNDAIGVKLKELSLEELKELHESDIELKQFYKEKLSDNPFKKKISHDVTQLKKDIHEVIKVSGDVQDDLIKAKEALETKKAEYLGLRNELGQLYTETHTRSEDMSRLGLSERLKSATMAEDENGERLSEQFLAGNLNCSEFLDSYIGSRALHHARKVKYDKMKKSKKVSKPRPGYSYIP